MGGNPQARRAHAAATWSLLLALGFLTALNAANAGIFPPKATVVLLVGVPGDVESEANYREQLQSWLELALTGRQVDEIFVLCDDPQIVAPVEKASSSRAGGTNRFPTVTALKADRQVFLGLGQTVGASTNPLVVISWGHGGKQGRTPVLHVRGPRITAADFKEFAGKPRAAGSYWVLMFRGSGTFAAEIAGEHRQLLSSEAETMYADDPVGMSLLLKVARDKPDLSFPALAEEMGRATGRWYKERNLARTEEPTYWAGAGKPRHLVAVEAEEEVEPATNATPKSASITSTNLSAAWKDIKRVQARDYPSEPAVTLRRRITYTLGSSPAITGEQEQFIQVLTSEGTHFGDFDVSFSAPHEDISFLDCEVQQPDGKLLRLDPDAVRDNLEPPVGDYQRSQRKFFSLPGVVPGSVLHVRYKTTWAKFPLPYVTLALPVGQDMPSLLTTVQVTVPKDAAFHFAMPGTASVDPTIQPSTYGTTYTWRLENLPGEHDDRLVSPEHSARLLISTFPDWATFAEWYGRICQLTDQVTPEIAARSRELTKDCKTDREKVEALYNYVTRLRYVAVPMGVNSYRPHAAANVLQNQFGDCKDKANLFNALLHEAGIEAHLVLVPRFSQAREEIPGLSFNHAISRVKLGNESLWLDTTDGVCRFGMLPPGDPGRNVLVIDGQAKTLTQLPAANPQEHVLKLQAEFDCSGGLDSWPVKLSATAVGYPDYLFRHAAQNTRRASAPLLATQLRPSAGSLALEDQGFTAASELDKDFAWNASGSFAGLAAKAGAATIIRLPFWYPREWDSALHQRKLPLYLNSGYPLLLQEQCLVTLPPKTKPAVLPGVLQNESGPLRWKIEWKQLAADKLGAKLALELPTGELNAADTRVFQQQLRRLLDALAEGAMIPPP